MVAVGGGVPAMAQRKPVMAPTAGFSDAMAMYFSGSAAAA